MPASKETKLTKWIGRSPLINRSPESPLVMKESILNLNLAHKHKKFEKEYTKEFPGEELPILAEFDLIYIHNFSYSCINGKFTVPRNISVSAIEIKYFRRKDKKGKINWHYYAGLDQSISYLKFGFRRADLWHFFDPSIKEEEAFKIINNLKDLLNKFQLPIYYAYYFCEDGEGKKGFDKTKLGFERESPNVDNPYKNNKQSDFINEFILKEIEKKYGELFKSTVDPKYPYTQRG